MATKTITARLLALAGNAASLAGLAQEQHPPALLLSRLRQLRAGLDLIEGDFAEDELRRDPPLQEKLSALLREEDDEPA